MEPFFVLEEVGTRASPFFVFFRFLESAETGLAGALFFPIAAALRCFFLLPLFPSPVGADLHDFSPLLLPFACAYLPIKQALLSK